VRQQRVLIVDDYEDGSASLADALTLSGHVCTWVRSPLEAFVSLGTFEADVVILEWKLMTGDAIGLTAELRAHSAKPLVVVAFSTADAPDGFVEREGVDAYLVKPKQPDVLAELIAGFSARAGE
jgi:DNA-binding response OmpR family regulator